MGDLAPRPRGGWQVGTHLSRMARDQQARAAADDPAPDVYTVKRDGDHIRIGHFTSVLAKKECCAAVIGHDELAKPLTMPCGHVA
jgi:hypothetical protein